jgi:hypothetical protein
VVCPFRLCPLRRVVCIRSGGVSPPMSFKGVRGEESVGSCLMRCSWQWAGGGFPFVGCRECLRVVAGYDRVPFGRVVCPLRYFDIAPLISPSISGVSPSIPFGYRWVAEG